MYLSVMAVSLRPSSEFGLGKLAEVFTAAYEGYFVPFKVDEAAMRFMVDAFALDLASSFVALDDDEPIGLANLGVRDERTWLGGVGVVPSQRRKGVGEQLTRALIDRARELGARELWLEVIVENKPAIKLYEKLGFEVTRELEVLSLAGGASESVAREIDVADAPREPSPPWQRAHETLANLSDLQAMAAGEGTAIFRVLTDGRVSLMQATGDVARLARALRSRGAVFALNYPAGGEISTALCAAGADVTLRQLEMVVPL
jgi:ribosomal protein S18 acetylase RimI-like enzyme